MRERESERYWRGREMDRDIDVRKRVKTHNVRDVYIKNGPTVIIVITGLTYIV